jgi:uncharacterized protein YbaR (Trm112 family)
MARSTAPAKTYLWCDACRRSYPHAEAPGGVCPVCNGPLREMGRLNAILRGFMSNELVSPEMRTKHLQLVRMIWTRNGMGEQYYRVLAPNLPYKQFESRVTELLCRGAEEGWVRFVFPPAPSLDESAYRLEFTDEERFVRELEEIAANS